MGDRDVGGCDAAQILTNRYEDAKTWSIVSLSRVTSLRYSNPRDEALHHRFVQRGPKLAREFEHRRITHELVRAFLD